MKDERISRAMYEWALEFNKVGNTKKYDFYKGLELDFLIDIDISDDALTALKNECKVKIDIAKIVQVKVTRQRSKEAQYILDKFK